MNNGPWLLGWAGGFVPGTILAGLVAAGPRSGGAVLALDLSRQGSMATVGFHVRRGGTYRLLLASTGRDSGLAGTVFAGELDVAVRDPADLPVIDRIYPPGTTRHRLPAGRGQTELARVELAATVRAWRLSAAVLEGDPRFAGATSELRIEPDPTAATSRRRLAWPAFLPAGLLLLLSALPGVRLARHGVRVPLVLTAAVLLALVAFPLR